MIKISVDEFTLVLQVSESGKHKYMAKYKDWPKTALALIDDFAKLADLEAIFGKMRKETNTPQGYNFAYSFGENDFYFAIAFHMTNMDMGVIVKFSAKALSYYLSANDINAIDFIKLVQCDYYKTRFSRLDIAVDYIEENINLNKLYTDLSNQELIVKYRCVSKNGNLYYRNDASKIKGYVNGSEIETIYLGKSNRNRFLRIYNKKVEQISNNGIYYSYALNVKSWIRFEAVFLGKNAHEITKIFLDASSDNYIEVISGIFLDKYRFYDKSDNLKEITKLIIKNYDSKDIHLQPEYDISPDLQKSIKNLIEHSGLLSTVDKVESIWGEKGVEEFMMILFYIYNNIYSRSTKVNSWVNKYSSKIIKKYPSFDQFAQSKLKKYV